MVSLKTVLALCAGALFPRILLAAIEADNLDSPSGLRVLLLALSVAASAALLALATVGLGGLVARGDRLALVLWLAVLTLAAVVGVPAMVAGLEGSTLRAVVAGVPGGSWIYGCAFFLFQEFAALGVLYAQRFGRPVAESGPEVVAESPPPTAPATVVVAPGPEVKDYRCETCGETLRMHARQFSTHRRWCRHREAARKGRGEPTG